VPASSVRPSNPPWSVFTWQNGSGSSVAQVALVGVGVTWHRVSPAGVPALGLFFATRWRVVPHPCRASRAHAHAHAHARIHARANEYAPSARTHEGTRDPSRFRAGHIARPLRAIPHVVANTR